MRESLQIGGHVFGFEAILNANGFLAGSARSPFPCHCLSSQRRGVSRDPVDRRTALRCPAALNREALLPEPA